MLTENEIKEHFDICMYELNCKSVNDANNCKHGRMKEACPVCNKDVLCWHRKLKVRCNDCVNYDCECVLHGYNMCHCPYKGYDEGFPVIKCRKHGKGKWDKKTKKGCKKCNLNDFIIDEEATEREEEKKMI